MAAILAQYPDDPRKPDKRPSAAGNMVGPDTFACPGVGSSSDQPPIDATDPVDKKGNDDLSSDDEEEAKAIPPPPESVLTHEQ